MASKTVIASSVGQQPNEFVAAFDEPIQLPKKCRIRLSQLSVAPELSLATEAGINSEFEVREYTQAAQRVDSLCEIGSKTFSTLNELRDACQVALDNARVSAYLARDASGRRLWATEARAIQRCNLRWAVQNRKMGLNYTTNDSPVNVMQLSQADSFDVLGSIIPAADGSITANDTNLPAFATLKASEGFDAGMLNIKFSVAVPPEIGAQVRVGVEIEPGELTGIQIRTEAGPQVFVDTILEGVMLDTTDISANPLQNFSFFLTQNRFISLKNNGTAFTVLASTAAVNLPGSHTPAIETNSADFELDNFSFKTTTILAGGQQMRIDFFPLTARGVLGFSANMSNTTQPNMLSGEFLGDRAISGLISLRPLLVRCPSLPIRTSNSETGRTSSIIATVLLSREESVLANGAVFAYRGADPEGVVVDFTQETSISNLKIEVLEMNEDLALLSSHHDTIVEIKFTEA